MKMCSAVAGTGAMPSYSTDGMCGTEVSRCTTIGEDLGGGAHVVQTIYLIKPVSVRN